RTESGPAAGALAAAHLGALMGRANLLSFDMGGTTAKACLIERGRPSIGNEFEVARLQRFKKGSGLPIKISSIDLIEIGAGGGSIARVDRFGLLKVGPDGRAFPRFAFGGAGPVHAYRVAEKLGVREVIAPFGAGVGSTIGLLAAPLAFDFVRTAAARVRALDWRLVGQLLEDMENEGR